MYAQGNTKVGKELQLVVAKEPDISAHMLAALEERKDRARISFVRYFMVCLVKDAYRCALGKPWNVKQRGGVKQGKYRNITKEVDTTAAGVREFIVDEQFDKFCRILSLDSDNARSRIEGILEGKAEKEIEILLAQFEKEALFYATHRGRKSKEEKQQEGGAIQAG